MAKKPDTKPKAPERKTYTVNAAGWVAGMNCKKGDPVELTARQAQYENVTGPIDVPAPKSAPKK